MRRALLALFALCLLPAVAVALEPGERAPAFELPGKTAPVSLAQARGKLVYLDFWASWCAPCRQSFPWMNAMHERYSAAGLQIIAVNLDTDPADAQVFLQKNPARFVLAFDPAGVTPRAYGVTGMPSSFLIGRDGKLIYAHRGFRTNEQDMLEQKIREAIK